MVESQPVAGQLNTIYQCGQDAILKRGVKDWLQVKLKIEYLIGGSIKEKILVSNKSYE